MQFYNSKIQLDKDVIDDIFANMDASKKMLVFGLGYDSKMWYYLNNKTLFVENKLKYIQLQEPEIKANTIKYDYIGITRKTFKTDEELKQFHIPSQILENGPYDIILIDGPEGFSDATPGRLLPIYWSKNFLSKEGSIIYVDDSSRPFENKCIERFFSKEKKTIFPNRLKCTKIYV